MSDRPEVPDGEYPFVVGDIVTCFDECDEWRVTSADYPLLEAVCIRVGWEPRHENYLGELDFTLFHTWA